MIFHFFSIKRTCLLSVLSPFCALCIITLFFLVIQATAQWSKCTQEVGLFGRVWRALASLHIFTICCMSFPSAMSMLCWQALWTPLPKSPVLVELSFFKINLPKMFIALLFLDETKYKLVLKCQRKHNSSHLQLHLQLHKGFAREIANMNHLPFTHVYSATLLW